MKILPKQQNILKIILENMATQSSDIHEEIIKSGNDLSLVSVKRLLSDMVESDLLKIIGLSRSTSYSISTRGRALVDIDAQKYIQIEPDERFGLSGYNFDYFSEFPTDIFDESELQKLDNASNKYRQKIKNLSGIVEEKELLRLIIEFSWKSSKIEGNTYTLLDTEKLIIDKQEAAGHDKAEAVMILNHKEAFDFIRKHNRLFAEFNLVNLEKLHAILVKDMGVSLGVRSRLVGVTGSKYQPLDNQYQIKEAINALSQAISKAATPYAKALLALVGISYIQPFEDGNKRTARLMANALLLSHKCAPLSYRSIEESEYREAVLVFYEINSIIPIKKIFVDQYIFATDNYAVKV